MIHELSPKLQAPSLTHQYLESFKLQAPKVLRRISEASSTKLRKLQAASLKPRAASLKLQAASFKLHDS
jgi:hypothetical protein